MPRKKLSTTVYLDEGQVVGLMLLRKKTGAASAYHIRCAIDAYIKESIALGIITPEDLEQPQAINAAPRSLFDRLRDEQAREREDAGHIRLLADQRKAGH